MTDQVAPYVATHAIRVVTATSLFDGHDAAINIMRRILQDSGAEVVHLGHNRSVQEIVRAAIQEDAQGVAISSYQGGHVEFFQYLVDLLRQAGADHVRVFGGGGGVIVPDEIRQLEIYGVTKIYAPEDGAQMGLQGIINDMLSKMDFSPLEHHRLTPETTGPHDDFHLAGLISAVEDPPSCSAAAVKALEAHLAHLKPDRKVPVIGITGTGGAGKSSLTDELIWRWRQDHPDLRMAVISCDPTRRKTGGALLGDRIRMNSIDADQVYMRSLATRQSAAEVSEALPRVIDVVKAAGFDLIIAETAGIGQGDSNIVDLADVSVYVMTSEFGAATQLEKIDMLDYADLVVVNKFEKRGAEDALRDVRKQLQRNRKTFDVPPDQMPVFGTIASKFNDDGVTAFYQNLLESITAKTGIDFKSKFPPVATRVSSAQTVIIPPERNRYLSEIAESVRTYHATTSHQADALRHEWHLKESHKTLSDGTTSEGVPLAAAMKTVLDEANAQITPQTRQVMEEWQTVREIYRQPELIYTVRGREHRLALQFESLAHSIIPKIALPKFKDPGELYRWMRGENVPGRFPFTGGVFPLKRADEDPTRMFAGEGGPARTNQRFKLLSADAKATRLSTAFDSVTLYGCDPAVRPDIYGKVGTSGVSICSLDDVKTLYAGFDLCAPSTSVSMTINGPAPIMLAMFLNTAIDQQLERYRQETGNAPDAQTETEIAAKALCNVRGTVQADILKEDQGQNTCIFSIDFALKMMGDIQAYFVQKEIRNFYSVSVSGYHIAEAGANPITQLALTLANGFTYLEYYLHRGMDVDQFAPNLSFFFSNGMDPEYTVIGRVARRIWAVALKHKYGANERAQRLKYHIQTSGRSLHSQDIHFNDIRTTLQALCAIYDNCNSLHTNAFDEAITTPSQESVRRALAIQLIINREWGLARNENLNQGSFIVEELTDLVEEAVLSLFDRISTRGGVMAAMETGYQRSKIQEESMYYEGLKHTGELPIIGVNTFRDPDALSLDMLGSLELVRSDENEKNDQLQRLQHFQERNADRTQEALQRLQNVALAGGNIFAELMQTVKFCSLGQITQALYDVGGQYRRNM